MKEFSESRPAKIVFFGTPEFVLPSMRKLAEHPSLEFCAVVTQADKPAGRGGKLRAPAAKILGLELGIPVFQPLSLKKVELARSDGRPVLRGAKSSEELCSFLSEQAPFDLFITAAYGKIIPSTIINFPSLGMVNIHPSLLPRWRGAAPLQWALFSGDRSTGISIMDVDEGLDTGGVYAKKEVQIQDDETMGTLHDKLAKLSADFLMETLPGILSGKLKSIPQATAGVTYAEKWDVEDQSISWEEPAEKTLRRIRTCSPYPGARTTLEGELVKVFAAHRVESSNPEPALPGTIVELNRSELLVSTGSESICIDELQFPGKKRLATKDLLHGKRLEVGMRFC